MSNAIRTIRIDSGKYEVDRNAAGLMVDCRRHGAHWPAGCIMVEHNKFIHALLDRIEQLEDEGDELLRRTP